MLSKFNKLSVYSNFDLNSNTLKAYLVNTILPIEQVALWKG